MRSEIHSYIPLNFKFPGGTSMAQWNPPPPTSPHCTLPPSAEDPLDDHTGDNVGDTVFSRSWVLSLLVMVVRSVQGDEMITNDPAMEGVSKGAQRGDDSMNSGKGTMATESEQTSSSYCETVKEPVRSKTSGNILQEREEGEEEGEEKEEEEEEEAISEDLENDLCRLWDVSVNHEVMLFLHEHHAVELLVGVVCRSTVPRLSEICIGILGNMACVETICTDGFGDAERIQRLLSFLDSTDSRILYETIRLINTCLSHKNLLPMWLSVIEQSPSTYQALLFILQGSTNEDLLRSAAVLLDRLLDCSEQLLSRWASRELVEAVCEAANQTRLSSFDATCSFVMTLQLLSTVESGIPCLVQCGQQVSTLLCEFLLTLEPTEDSLPSLEAALILLLTLCEASSTCRNQVCMNLRGEQIQQFLLKLLTETSHSDSEETAGESAGAAVSREARVCGFSTEDGSSSTAPVGIMASDKQCRTHVHNEDIVSPQPCNSSTTNEFHQSQNREVSNTDTTGRPASLHAWIQKLLDYTSTQ